MLSSRFCPRVPAQPNVLILLQVLTGDALPVARHVCRRLAIPTEHCTDGAQLAAAGKKEFARLARECTVFAKVAPHQKVAIVAELQVTTDNKHCSA